MGKNKKSSVGKVEILKPGVSDFLANEKLPPFATGTITDKCDLQNLVGMIAEPTPYSIERYKAVPLVSGKVLFQIRFIGIGLVGVEVSGNRGLYPSKCFTYTECQENGKSLIGKFAIVKDGENGFPVKEMVSTLSNGVVIDQCASDRPGH